MRQKYPEAGGAKKWSNRVVGSAFSWRRIDNRFQEVFKMLTSGIGKNSFVGDVWR
jgi:hypothetical protein